MGLTSWDSIFYRGHDEIDKDAAQKDLDAALLELANLNISDAAYAFVKNRVDLAQARLDA